MTDQQFTEPILILAFNRPDRLRALIDQLREVQPAQVFISIDGPRATVPEDEDLVRHTQDLAGAIDWPCEVRTNFALENLGCGKGVSSGISWFFSQVERGIILEDDVMPTLEFFTFCSNLLDHYESDPRVFAISGCNFAPPDVPTEQASYRFSGITHVWGWATWRRSWNEYQFDMRNWRKRLPLRARWKAMGGNLGGFIYWTAVFDWMRFGKLDTWDYQWSLAQMAQGGLTATSNTNLVDNVGFASDATHTVNRPSFIRPSEPLPLPLRHPQVSRDLRADRWIRGQVLQASTQSAWRMVKDNVLQRMAAVKNRAHQGEEST